MSKFFTSKSVAVSQKNVTASIVGFGAAPTNPFFRFTLKADGDFGASSTGKMHSLGASNDGIAGIRASFNAYRKATVTPSDLVDLFKKEAAEATADEIEQFGVKLPASRSNGRGFVVRGSTSNGGAIHIDIPHTTIAVLSNPHTTSKERDAVAPLSNKGNKRLLASSSGFAGYMEGALGLSFNVMVEADQTIDPSELATVFGLSADNPLFTNLCGASTMAAMEGTKNTLFAFSEAIRSYLRGLKAEQVSEAVTAVFESKLKASGITANADASEKAAVLSSLKLDTARTWVIVALVEAAMNKARIDHVVAGNDISELHSALPKTNDEIIDLFDSTPENDAVKNLVKKCLLDGLQSYMEGGKPTKKHRSEK